MADNVRKLFDADITLDYEDGYPPVINHEQSTQKLKKVAEKIVTKQNIITSIDKYL